MSRQSRVLNKVYLAHSARPQQSHDGVSSKVGAFTQRHRRRLELSRWSAVVISPVALSDSPSLGSLQTDLQTAGAEAPATEWFGISLLSADAMWCNKVLLDGAR